MKKYSVLIIDDSAVVRQTLSEIINSDPKLEVMGTATDPYYAADKIKKEAPDVITLDIEMPRMDGLTFLKKVMSQHPMPVVVISSLTAEGTDTALKAMEFGAVDIITKPNMDTRTFIRESKIRICDAVKAAANASIKKLQKRFLRDMTVQPKYSADAVLSQKKPKSMTETTEVVVAIGASTGGTEAIKDILVQLPHDTPGIVVVQHMPEYFTSSYAQRLDELSKITVKEAQHNDTIIRGQALIAPGNYHTMVKRSGARYYVEVKSGQLVNRHRPSVDVLFRSTSRYAGKNALGIILTGMSDDGAKGLMEMKEAGASTVAQSEESCVVFGMPKVAINTGAANKVFNLREISEYISKY